jgi:hypothetical protein
VANTWFLLTFKHKEFGLFFGECVSKKCRSRDDAARWWIKRTSWVYSTTSQNAPRQGPTQITCFCWWIQQILCVVGHWREIWFLHCWIFHIEMRAAGSSVSQRRDRRLAGIECKGRDKVFPASFSYDQHRSCGHLRGTTCYSSTEKTRSNVYAVKRPNMSTVYCHTTGDCFPPQPRFVNCVFNIFNIFCKL